VIIGVVEGESSVWREWRIASSSFACGGITFRRTSRASSRRCEMTRTSSTLPSRATAGDSRRTRSSFPRAALTSRSCSRLENHFLPAPHLRRIPPLLLPFPSAPILLSPFVLRRQPPVLLPPSLRLPPSVSLPPFSLARRLFPPLDLPLAPRPSSERSRSHVCTLWVCVRGYAHVTFSSFHLPMNNSEITQYPSIRPLIFFEPRAHFEAYSCARLRHDVPLLFPPPAVPHPPLPPPLSPYCSGLSRLRTKFINCYPAINVSTRQGSR